MRQRKSPVQPPLPALLSAIVLLLLVLAAPSARGESALPFGPSQGGLGASSERVEQLRRIGKEAKAQSEERKQLEQVLVLPQRPGKNNVRYYEFDWRRYDMLDDRGVGGVRFYFYSREEEVARTAAALVRDQYEMLAEKFHYRPTTRVPYLLYNSHREFENTNVFFVNEYILGVTSPADLRMALPYWGEIERFREVSTHEMVHQFEIQKLADRAAALGMESPIGQIPLWFTEGLAEYYAKDGIDKETDMFARDVLLNARPEKGYAAPVFWDDAQANFIYTYKMGQLRVAFLSEQYGERIIQGILDQASRLGGGRQQAAVSGEDFDTFPELVARLTGEKPDAIAQRFSAWLKRRYLPAYLQTRQEPPVIEPLDLEGEPDAFSVADDGFTILYRTVERDTGRARLYLADRRDKESAHLVATDGVPGLESLHPVLRGVTAVSGRRLAFFARRGQADSLYVQPFTRTQTGNRVAFELGERKRIELTAGDIIEAGDPVFSPDGTRVAFFGLDTSGKVDLWTADIATGTLQRLTNDRYAERDLTWIDEPPADYGVEGAAGGDGTLVFCSDATEHRKMNLFAMDPATQKTARLTAENADHRGPYLLGGGQIAFSSDVQGKSDLHLYDGTTKSVRRLTDFVTQLVTPAPGPRGLMAIGFYGGQFKIFDVPSEQFLSLEERPALDGNVPPPPPLPEEPIPPEAPLYDAFSRNNWRLENGVAAVGTSSVGQGALLFGDVFSDRNVVLQLAIYGSLTLTDALGFYIDRSRRDVWGVGLFHTFTQRRDSQAPGFGTDVFFLQREFGLTGLWSYPFDTFTRVEARLIAQGVNRSFQFPISAEGFLIDAISLPGLRTWESQRGGYDLEGLATLRFGYDTTRFRFPGGAFGGGSFLFELGGGYLPLRTDAHVWGTTDAQFHHRLFGTLIHLRAAGGLSGGSIFGRQFFLSSFDNLRNYNAGDRRLIGTAYAVTNLDWELPLDQVIRLALITNVKAVFGMDFGSVAQRFEDLWDNRSLAYVLGTNLGLGPFEIRLHWARSINIGAVTPNENEWVTNISLRYAYF